MKKQVILSWSGGKDSALALHNLQNTGHYDIVTLLTTVTEEYDRISMHGVRRNLLEQQAKALELPLEKIYIPKNSSNDEYELNMQKILETYLKEGVISVVFGDIFLEDIRKYREENLAKIGMKGIFPLWNRNTTKLAHTFIDLGFKAVISCVDSKVLDKDFVGRQFDRQFLSNLPATVDPCGENGEFHSFVYDGPIFQKKIVYTLGEVVLRENQFYFCDLRPL